MAQAAPNVQPGGIAAGLASASNQSLPKPLSANRPDRKPSATMTGTVIKAILVAGLAGWEAEGIDREPFLFEYVTGDARRAFNGLVERLLSPSLAHPLQNRPKSAVAPLPRGSKSNLAYRCLA